MSFNAENIPDIDNFFPEEPDTADGAQSDVRIQRRERFSEANWLYLAITDIEPTQPVYAAEATGHEIYNAQAKLLSRSRNWDLSEDVACLGSIPIDIAVNLWSMHIYPCKYCPTLMSIEQEIHPHHIDFSGANIGGAKFADLISERFQPIAKRYSRELKGLAPRFDITLPGRAYWNDKLLDQVTHQISKTAAALYPTHELKFEIGDTEFIEPSCELEDFELSLFSLYEIYNGFLTENGDDADLEWQFSYPPLRNLIDLLDCSEGRLIRRFW